MITLRTFCQKKGFGETDEACKIWEDLHRTEFDITNFELSKIAKTKFNTNLKTLLKEMNEEKAEIIFLHAKVKNIITVTIDGMPVYNF